MSSSLLFSKYLLKSNKSLNKNIILKNRIVVAPMCQYISNNGEANDWHLFHWSNLLNSGAGLFIIEATGVSPEGRISPNCLGLWDDKTQDAIANNLTRARKLAPYVPVCIQLGHAGRKASTQVPWEGNGIVSIQDGGWYTYAPSSIPFNSAYNTIATNNIPIQLTQENINKIKNDFVESAKRAQDIGIEAIEIHSAHGYLIHQFLSPLSNHRTDKYGGSLENRLRFPLEIFEAVREVYTGVLGLRLSATDWVEGGWNLEDSQIYSNELVKRGCDFLHVSTGGLSLDQKITVTSGYQVPYAQSIKKYIQNKIPVITVGMITDPHHAEKIIQDEQADLVALARGFLYQPRWGWDAAVKLNGQVEVNGQYWRALPRRVYSK